MTESLPALLPDEDIADLIMAGDAPSRAQGAALLLEVALLRLTLRALAAVPHTAHWVVKGDEAAARVCLPGCAACLAQRAVAALCPST